MKKIICVPLLLTLCAGMANAETIARFGVITDSHHTNKPDTTSRTYSAALEKTIVDPTNETVC